MNRLAEVLTISDENEIKPKRDWREHFSAVAEPLPRGIAILDSIANAKAHTEEQQEWTKEKTPTGMQR